MVLTKVLGIPWVLIVDDDAPTRLLIHVTLGDDSYHIVETGDSSEALRLIGKIRPQVVLLDLDLGTANLDGFGICRLLRERRDLDGVQVILVTGHDTDELRARALSLGVQTYVTKPFSPTALVKEVDRLVTY